jgi:hypothetical protein
MAGPALKGSQRPTRPGFTDGVGELLNDRHRLPAQPRIFPGAVASKVESALRFASGVARDRPAIPMPGQDRRWS